MRVNTKTNITSEILRSPGTISSRLSRVVAESTFAVERDVKEQMQAPKRGRVYARGAITRAATKGTRALGLRERAGKNGKRRAITGYKIHRASAPGEAPAIDTGQLVNSVRSQIKGLVGRIRATAAHASRLEFLMRRPSFGPALERERPRFLRRVDSTVKRMCDG